MTKPGLSWRNARLPENTAVFAVGDIHAHDELLQPMLEAIEKKIKELPQGVTAQVIFIGDYIDRGLSTPHTIDLLLDFERRIAAMPNAKVTFLCGNHDEYFKRLLEAPHFTDENFGDPNDPKDHRHCRSGADGQLSLKGLEGWMVSGGGLKTFQDYMPEMDLTLFDQEHKCFNRNHPQFNIGIVEEMVKKLSDSVPPAHKDFFNRIYANSHVIIGDYLFTHAGIDPEKTLEQQGIGENAKKLNGADYLDFLMLRNPFLWRDDDNLPRCPYVVVHGHTPSVIQSVKGTLADTQKDYRLCIDTNVYGSLGSLTCFMRHGDDVGFMAAHRSNPLEIQEYDIGRPGQHLAEIIHRALYPKYHQPGATAGRFR